MFILIVLGLFANQARIWRSAPAGRGRSAPAWGEANQARIFHLRSSSFSGQGEIRASVEREIRASGEEANQARIWRSAPAGRGRSKPAGRGRSAPAWGARIWRSAPAESEEGKVLISYNFYHSSFVDCILFPVISVACFRARAKPLNTASII